MKYYREKYGVNWDDTTSTNFGTQLSLDKNNAITYTKVIQADGKTKDQLYVLLNYWFASNFRSSNYVINLNDKELGTILASYYDKDIFQYTKGSDFGRDIDLHTVIKCDIKDKKVRVTVTAYIKDGRYFVRETKLYHAFSHKAKSFAFINSHFVMDKIEECVKNGLSGNETDNW